MPLIAGGLNLEDPLAGLGAEVIAPALVVEVEVGGVPRAAVHLPPHAGDAGHLQPAHVADQRRHLRHGPLEAALADVVDHHVPALAVGVVPARVLLLQPVALGRRDAGDGPPPLGRAVDVDTDLLAVVEGLDVVQEIVPVPRQVEADCLDVAGELVDHPFVHELLERVLAELQRRVVVHGDAAEGGELLPDTPEADIDQPLRLRLAPVLDHDADERRADLRMARLVGLDALQHGGEGVIAGLGRVCREPDELQVGEALLEGEVGHDRGADRVAGVLDVVERMAQADDDPVLGLRRLVRPVEHLVLLDEFVGEIHLDLAVAHLVEGAEGRHVAHPRRAAEARHPGEGRRRVELGEADRAEVQREQGLPVRRGVLEVVRARQRRLHRIGADVLVALGLDIVAVADLVGLVEGLPLLDRNPERIAELGREQLVLVDVAGRPVGRPREVVPIVHLKQCHAMSPSRCGVGAGSVRGRCGRRSSRRRRPHSILTRRARPSGSSSRSLRRDRPSRSSGRRSPTRCW